MSLYPKGSILVAPTALCTMLHLHRSVVRPFQAHRDPRPTPPQHTPALTRLLRDSPRSGPFTSFTHYASPRLRTPPLQSVALVSPALCTITVPLECPGGPALGRPLEQPLQGRLEAVDVVVDQPCTTHTPQWETSQHSTRRRTYPSTPNRTVTEVATSYGHANN
jgi:hypothetical protein